MRQPNIESLTNSLLALGCEPTIETQLRCNLCFSPAQFDLSYCRHSGEDACQFTIRIERNQSEEYLLKYYTALLRKKIELPKELLELDRRFSKIEWEDIAKGRLELVNVSPATIQSAFELLGELSVAGINADLLRFKHWQGTSLENLNVQQGLHRSAWEISERFYFFDDLEVISFSEAVRFLNSRWMERQLSARKRLIEKMEDRSDNGSGKNLLLKKKPGQSSKRKLFKN